MAKLSFRKFPHYRQLYRSDCGPTCLRMIAKHHGKSLSYKDLDKYIETSQGILLSDLVGVAEEVGFQALPVQISWDRLKSQAPLPAIVHWQQKHFLVVYKIENDKVYVSDPASERLTFTKEEFLQGWLEGDAEDPENKGVVLLLEPGPEWQNQKQKTPKRRYGLKEILGYASFYKLQIYQLIFGLLLGSVFQFFSPFFTRAVIDFGIAQADTFFLVVILISQLLLFGIGIGVEFFRARLLLHLSSRLNILIISDFLIKLMKLPLNFFTSRITGDLIQRIQDHSRVEAFISKSLLSSFFSVFSILVFTTVLAVFSPMVAVVFGLTFVAEMSWIFFYLARVEQLDHKTFALNSQDQSKVFELINGIQDIKLHNVEDQKRWEWERIQVNAFNVSLSRLKLKQVQTAGQRFFNFSQMAIITFVCAFQVIQGTMTIGTMLAILFVLGQLNGPINQLINFVLQGQMAMLSMERLMEIHDKEEEKAIPKPTVEHILSHLKPLPLKMEGVTFGYHKTGPPVLKDLHLEIPAGKVTAIVGVSGSGKTTLLKMLLKFQNPASGHILVGEEDLQNINSSFWRSRCGVVMQDSFIFSDTIAGNIALVEKEEEEIDKEALVNACRVANILDFIESLPLGFDTRIGQSGKGLSRGQRQRLLIARAVYKNPQYLFFDEATNALDAENEKAIVENLERFFEGKTVIVVAHRLSTVRNADQIIVLGDGKILEQGSHEELVRKKSRYYSLVKNQLELGN